MRMGCDLARAVLAAATAQPKSNMAKVRAAISERASWCQSGGRLDVVVDPEEVCRVVFGLQLREALQIAPERGVDAGAQHLVVAQAREVEVDVPSAVLLHVLPRRSHPR